MKALFDDLYLIEGTYNNNKRKYLGLESNEHESYCDITINLDNAPLKENEIYLNGDLSNYTKNKLLETGIFKDTHDDMKYNYGIYKKLEVDYDKLKEYLPYDDLDL
jgi:hypothetical protein